MSRSTAASGTGGDVRDRHTHPGRCVLVAGQRHQTGLALHEQKPGRSGELLFVTERREFRQHGMRPRPPEGLAQVKP